MKFQLHIYVKSYKAQTESDCTLSFGFMFLILNQHLIDQKTQTLLDISLELSTGLVIYLLANCHLLGNVSMEPLKCYSV